MILRSGEVDGVSDDLLYYPEKYADSKRYKSLERFFKAELSRLTIHDYEPYIKSKLPIRFRKEKAVKKIIEPYVEIDNN